MTVDRYIPNFVCMSFPEMISPSEEKASFFLKVNTTKSPTDILIILTQTGNSLTKQLLPILVG